jgi:hypothetical protein
VLWLAVTFPAVIARASDRLQGLGNFISASPNPAMASRIGVSETTMEPADAGTPVTSRPVPAVMVMPMTVPAVESHAVIGIEAVRGVIVQPNDIALGPDRIGGTSSQYQQHGDARAPAKVRHAFHSHCYCSNPSPVSNRMGSSLTIAAPCS